MKSAIDKEAVTKRLKRIEGQVRGIIKMLDTNISCEDILIQVNSVKSSLQKTAQYILVEHLEDCILDSIRKGRAGDTIRKLTSAVEQFSRIS